jgi:hypothetical protein
MALSFVEMDAVRETTVAAYAGCLGGIASSNAPPSSDDANVFHAPLGIAVVPTAEVEVDDIVDLSVCVVCPSSSFYAGMTTTTTTPTQFLSVVRPPLSTSQFALGDKRKDSESDRRKRDGMAAIRALREARASTGLADGRTEKDCLPPLTLKVTIN